MLIKDLLKVILHLGKTKIHMYKVSKGETHNF